MSKTMEQIISKYEKNLVNAILEVVIQDIATPEFVYEIMNAPTNGVAVDIIRKRLESAKQRTPNP